MRGVLRAFREQEQYGKALLLLGIFYVLSAVKVPVIQELSGITFVLILLMITANERVPRRLRRTAFAAAGVSALLSVTRVVEPTDFTIALDALSTTLIVVLTLFAILIRLFTVGSVTVSTVMGGFLAYALIGFASAYLFIGIDALTTQDFFAQGPAEPDDFIYFSMVTLSTVGFGDLTAATDLGRRLVVIEALTGQVFIVVLISRLISLWGAPSTSDAQE